MRDVPASISAAWNEGLFVGDRKPIARITVQHPKMYLRKYSLMSTFSYKNVGDVSDVDATVVVDPSHGHKINQSYADFFFTKLHTPKELPNVKSVSWSRSTDADVADCTIECWNTAELPIGATPSADDLDQPGFYTYSRGASAFSSRWAHTRNDWFGLLMPDNIIRTYEGYGFDPDSPPELDDNLVQTGVWMIDSVTMNTEGTLTLSCRDVGRILMDQMYYPPVVPSDYYNEDWSNWDGDFPNDPVSSKVKLKVKATDSSNTPWIGNSLTHSVAGHKLQHAFDGDPSSFWLSIGNVAASRRFAYEWVEATVGNKSVTTVRVRTKKKGYTCYISLKIGGKWQGKTKINYHEDGIGMNGGDVAYVKSVPINTEKFVDINLGKTYNKVEAIRITLGNLQNFHFGPYTYRGGIRDVEVYGNNKTSNPTTKAEEAAFRALLRQQKRAVLAFLAKHGGLAANPLYGPRLSQIETGLHEGSTSYLNALQADYKALTNNDPETNPVAKYLLDAIAGVTHVISKHYRQGPTGSNPNKYSDYTHIVKMFCAWGGFFWPDTGRQRISDGTFRTVAPRKFDTGVLGAGVRGRVWGDFMESKTSGPSPLSHSNFDKKSLMEGISYVRDILGFLFFIDETGGVQWRLPNLYNRGCLRSTLSDNPGFVKNFAHLIDEKTVLRSLDMKIDVKNVREAFFVGDKLGKIGSFSPGFNPNPTGLRRMAGWTDQNFEKQAECQLMGDMLSLRQLMTYRTDQLTIPANPAIQIDDQVRIFERVTSEGYLHYVKGISSTLDMESGEWTYNLDTHWLGFDDPTSKWLFKLEQFDPVTEKYLLNASDQQLQQAQFERSEAMRGTS